MPTGECDGWLKGYAFLGDKTWIKLIEKYGVMKILVKLIPQRLMHKSCSKILHELKMS